MLHRTRKLLSLLRGFIPLNSSGVCSELGKRAFNYTAPSANDHLNILNFVKCFDVFSTAALIKAK